MHSESDKEKNGKSIEPYFKIQYRILEVPDIGLSEKLLLAYFHSFGQRGCSHNNATLAGIFMTPTYKISQYIDNLQKFIDIKCPKDYRRIIWTKTLCDLPAAQPDCPPGSKLIPLTQGKFAIVDADDYERLNGYRWLAHRSRCTFYASRRYKRNTIHMHRHIMNVPKGMVCDHINHNGLDNRKSNLRICTKKQNSYNCTPRRGCMSRYKGVLWLPEQKKWKSRILKDGKRHCLGVFASEVEAAIAYDLKADELFGRFAYLNFPQFLDAEKWLQEIFKPR